MSDRSKGTRAAYTQREAEAGHIYLPDPKVGRWAEPWAMEHEQYPYGDKVDRVDATSQLMVHWWFESNNGGAQILENLSALFG